MPRWLVILGLVLVASSCTSTSNQVTADGYTEVRAPSDVQISENCKSDATYRAIFQETDPATGETLTELLHEVGPDQIRIELTGGTSALIQGERAWTYDDGDWTELATTPVQPLRVPWVNNFVTAPEVADAFTSVDQAIVGQYGDIGARKYQPTLAEMSETFDDRFRNGSYDAESSSFEYWTDACDDMVLADITLTFAGDDAATAKEMGLPVRLRYTYDLYDIGTEITQVTPTGMLEPIKRP